MIELVGTINGLTRDYETKKPLLTIALQGEPPLEMMELGGKELSLQLSIKRERRSRDANAYFHVLCDDLRKKLGISMAHCKNHLIASYGQIEYQDDGTQTILKTNIQPEKMREQEFLHTWPIRTEKQGDMEIIFYRVYRGSHTYDTAEMHQLIAGTVAECKEQGIETATPLEIARMEALWQKKIDRQSGAQTGIGARTQKDRSGTSSRNSGSTG